VWITRNSYPFLIRDGRHLHDLCPIIGSTMNCQSRAIRIRRLVLLAAACFTLVGAGCGIGDGKLFGRKADARPGASQGRIADRDLPRLLLANNAMPAGFVPAGTYLLPNEEVAKFFLDPDAAARSMNERGRMQGVVADFRLGGVPRASQSALAISSSVAWYGTAAGAEATIVDPTMELVIHRLGVEAGEIRLSTVGQESRAFRGIRKGDGADWISYMVLFRRDNMVSALVVVVSAANDDGGRLALQLAQRQAVLPIPEAVH
jgi:hypothetical protein